MSKDYTADRITDFELKLLISTPTDPKIDGNGKCVIAMQQITAIPRNGNMLVQEPPRIKYYGTPQDTPYTAKEVGDAIKNFSNLNTIMYNDIKDYYLDLLSEDIT